MSPRNDFFSFFQKLFRGNNKISETTINIITEETRLVEEEVLKMENAIKIDDRLKNISIKKIADAVAYFYGFNVIDLKQRSRKKDVVLARQIAMYLSREYAQKSYPVIGSYFGSRDHTTAIHAHKKIQYLLESSTDLLKQIDEISKILHGQIVMPVEKVMARAKRLHLENNRKHLFSLPSTSSPETIQKDKKILQEYRDGKTFRQVGKVFNLTGSRIQQLVRRAILRELIEQEAAGFEIDREEYMKQEKLKIIKDRSLLKNPPVKEEPKRWSRFYPSCRGCGTDTISHFKRGYCERCSGILNKDRREQIISSKHNKCENCGIERFEARRQFGRDFYITGAKNWKNFKILCRGCFLKETGLKLSKSRIKRKNT
ncbi:MAG: helix-turn-helix domain-containing protein [Candidatus Levybacteria bacterium]|nr:helix-turn-helix domain-containing protein [Candidatus Levybacteria bacterium]